MTTVGQVNYPEQAHVQDEVSSPTFPASIPPPVPNNADAVKGGAPPKIDGPFKMSSAEDTPSMENKASEKGESTINPKDWLDRKERKQVLKNHAKQLKKEVDELSEAEKNEALEKRAKELKGQRDQLYSQGQNNRLDHGFETGKAIPDQVRKLYRGAYPLVRKWWTGAKPSAAHKESIEKINKQISAHNERHNRKVKDLFAEDVHRSLAAHPELDTRSKDPDMEKQIKDFKEAIWSKNYIQASDPDKRERARDEDHFPMSLVWDHIAGIGRALAEVQKMEQMENRNDEANRHLKKSALHLIQGSALFTKTMENVGLDSKLMIPNNVKDLFDRLADYYEGDKSKLYEVMDTLRDPTKEQGRVWQEAESDLREFFSLTAPDKVLTDEESTKMGSIIQKVQGKNDELMTINKSLDLLEADHMFPLNEIFWLGNTIVSKQFDTPDARRHIQGLIKAQLITRGQKELANTLFPKIRVEIDNKQLEDQRRRLLMAIEEDYDMANENGGTASAEFSAPTISNNSTASAGLSAPSMSNNSTALAGFSAPSMPNNSTTSTTAHSVEHESLFYDEDDGTMEVLSYEDGKTEYGALEAVRPTTSANASYARFILNAGTEKRPFYRVVRGSDLGPGAQALQELKGTPPKFDCAARKKASRSVSKSTIKLIGPCVELPSAANDGKRKRRPDLYVRVQYHTDKLNNPLADQHEFPDTEWLSRTEFQQLVGKKYAEDKEKVMLARYRQRTLYFEDCKRKKLHPDTQKRLSNEDARNSPWLFPDDCRTIQVIFKEADEEMDMSGVMVDGEQGNVDEL